MTHLVSHKRVRRLLSSVTGLFAVSFMGCSAAQQVPFEAEEVIQVEDVSKAWGEFIRYLDPQKTHAPLRLTDKKLFYYPTTEMPEVRFLAEQEQIVFRWCYYFPSAIGRDDLEFEFVTAFESADPTSFEIWNGEEDSEGWFVTANCGAFWSGEYKPDSFLSSINPGQATLDEDGFSFPSAVGLAFAGKEAPEFRIGKLHSKRECLRVIGILTTAFESCGFGSDKKPTSASVMASVPRTKPNSSRASSSSVRAGYSSGTVRGGYRH